MTIPNAASSSISAARLLQIHVEIGVAASYGGSLPVRLSYTPNDVMKGWYTVKAEVPGQSRSVTVTAKQMAALTDSTVVEKVVEEVKFAIFLLLDEDEEEA